MMLEVPGIRIESQGPLALNTKKVERGEKLQPTIQYSLNYLLPLPRCKKVAFLGGLRLQC